MRASHDGLAGAYENCQQSFRYTAHNVLLTALINLAEHNGLEGVVASQYTGTSDTTEDIGASALEESLGTTLSDDLLTGIEHGLVVFAGARCHHHATADSIDGVRSQTSDGCNGPTEKERREEVAFERAHEDNWLWRLESVSASGPPLDHTY